MPCILITFCSVRCKKCRSHLLDCFECTRFSDKKVFPMAVAVDISFLTIDKTAQQMLILKHYINTHRH